MISEARARKYCKEDISLIENYEIAVNDQTQIWHCHHRRETIYTREGLIEIGEYYHRPACELIFLTKTEHNKIHKTGNKYRIGKHHSEKTKKKLSEYHIGKHLSDETKKKLSESHIGKHHSEKTRKKMSKAMMGNHNSPTKPILQYTKDGEFIKEWTSAKEASKVLGIEHNHISTCCKGKLKSAYGFVWKYAEDKLSNIQFINT